MYVFHCFALTSTSNGNWKWYVSQDSFYLKKSLTHAKGTNDHTTLLYSTSFHICPKHDTKCTLLKWQEILGRLIEINKTDEVLTSFVLFAFPMK